MLESWLRRFPIGSLVVTPKLKLQATRSGAHAGRTEHLPWAEAQYEHHLLDGQQRANAVALGFLDPFPEPNPEPPEMDTLLWLDLTPESPQPVRGFENSTRSHLLRVTTRAHPWGFKVSDNREPERLEHRQAMKAQENFRQHSGNTTPDRPLPRQGWPMWSILWNHRCVPAACPLSTPGTANPLGPPSPATAAPQRRQRAGPARQCPQAPASRGGAMPESGRTCRADR